MTVDVCKRVVEEAGEMRNVRRTRSQMNPQCSARTLENPLQGQTVAWETQIVKDRSADGKASIQCKRDQLHVKIHQLDQALPFPRVNPGHYLPPLFNTDSRVE